MTSHYDITFTCIQCGITKTSKSKYSGKGLYCSNQCQKDYEHKRWIEKWKAGEITGLMGKKNISPALRRYLLNQANYKCVKCGWGEKRVCDNVVPLEIDHVDGNYQNNSESNLRVLCPNYHSLTSTYKNLNRGKSTRNYK